MKTILCYGDSLTFGANPEPNGLRHPYEDRWPTALETALSGKVRVIAEGLGGRTTAFDDGTGSVDLNGARILPVLLKSHEPLDCVVIMLGTNDLKPYVNGTAHGAAMGMQRLTEIVRKHPYNHQSEPPKVVIVAPPKTVRTDHVMLGPMFVRGGEESAKFAGYYKQVADDAGVAFFDAATVAKASPLDGVHLDAENTRAIGTALAPVVAKMLGL